MEISNLRALCFCNVTTLKHTFCIGLIGNTICKATFWEQQLKKLIFIYKYRYLSECTKLNQLMMYFRVASIFPVLLFNYWNITLGKLVAKYLIEVI